MLAKRVYFWPKHLNIVKFEDSFRGSSLSCEVGNFVPSYIAARLNPNEMHVLSVSH